MTRIALIITNVIRIESSGGQLVRILSHWCHLCLELLYKEEIFQLAGLCMEIHRELGKGHDEVIYKDAFAVELGRAGIPFSREKNYESRTKESSCLSYWCKFVKLVSGLSQQLKILV